MSEIKVGDVWRDNGVHDTVTILSVTYSEDDFSIRSVEGQFGDGSGPHTYTLHEFLRDCVPVSLSSLNPQIGEHVDMPFPRPVFPDLWSIDASLDPDDPFERVIIDMVETNRRKRADYAVDGSPWSNFDDVANSLGIPGFTPVDSANFNIEQKSARLRSLRKNGRMDDPANESVADTYLDRAVYSVIALAMHKYPDGKVDGDD